MLFKNVYTLLFLLAFPWNMGFAKGEAKKIRNCHDAGCQEDCFEVFVTRTKTATREYADEYDACSKLAPTKRREWTHERENDRDEMINGTEQICNSIKNCASMPTDWDFFNCNAETGYINAQTLADMNLQSSSVLVDLNDKYTEVEKEMLQCKIDAQRTYLNESIDAYRTLRACLNS